MMKTIQIRSGDTFSTRKVLADLVGGGQTRPMTPGEMRKRLRILDVLDAATGDSFQLEDADHALLKEIVGEAVWVVIHRDLIQIIDDVEKA